MIKMWQLEGLTFYQFILSHNIEGRMSKTQKKENAPLKFDTSSANIGCFIRGKSKNKGEHDRGGSSFKSKKRAKHEREKQL
jgi:hypothetical protein